MTTDLEARMRATAERWIDSCYPRFAAEQEGRRAAEPDLDLDSEWSYIRQNWVSLSADKIKTWARSVPPLYRTAALADLSPGQHRDELAGYLLGGARNLFLAGPVGTGKSYAAWAIAHEAVAIGIPAAVWSTPRLLLDMRPEGDESAFRRACNVSLLVLDDLGAARPTDWAVEQMFAIADERTNHQRRTVITTNANYDGLVSLWGGPTMDRLRDKALRVTMTGQSRRGAA